MSKMNENGEFGMQKDIQKEANKDLAITRGLTVLAGILAAALLFVAFVYTEVTKGILALAIALLVVMVAIAYRNQKALRAAAGTRSVRYGTNALITTILVLGIVVVINFLNFNHYYRKDLTKSGGQSISEQTIKILKDLKSEVKVTAYVKGQQRDQVKSLLDQYHYHSKKFVIEYVDPDRDRTRTKAANIKRYGTLVLEQGKKESRVEEANEEKLTNALVKLSKDKNQLVCFLTGHGEKSPEAADEGGYSNVKKEMSNSAWEIKLVNLLEETKVPPTCDVLVVLGPSRAFFEKETEALKTYLDEGGHAFIALDPVLQGEDHSGPLNDILTSWGVKVQRNLVVDPLSRMMGVQASVPMVPSFNREHKVTKDFTESSSQVIALFPLASSIELLKETAQGLKVTWLAKSTPNAFGETDLRGLASGQAKFDNGDLKGPLDMAVAIEGKKPNSKAAQESKIVVIGTSGLASNGFSRHAFNQDFFLNSLSWLVSDDSLISIRAKEEGSQAITISEVEGRYIQLLTWFFIPLLSLLAGIVVYIRRRKL